MKLAELSARCNRGRIIFCSRQTCPWTTLT